MTTFPALRQAGTYARLPMSEAFSVAVDELEGFLSRLTRADAVLRLERESGKHWIVVDLANPRVLSERDQGQRDMIRQELWRSTPTDVVGDTGTPLNNPRPEAGPRSESTYEPTVMIRASRNICERFMVAHVAKHPEARIVGGEPTGGRVPAAADTAASESPVSQAALAGAELASPLTTSYLRAVQ